MSKPLPLEGPSSRKTIPTRYFFNKDLEYLNHENIEKKYALSLSNVKAARYEQKDKDPTEFKLQEGSTVMFANKIKRFLKKDKITRVDLKGPSFELLKNRVDQKEYTFMEAELPRLNLNDIEYLYLLKIQEKIQNLDGVDEYALTNALLLYIRRIVIKKKVEDAQLGAESYQTKLNLTKPQFMIEVINQARSESDKPSLMKRSHDDQYPLENHKGEKKRRKKTGGSPSKKDKSHGLHHKQSYTTMSHPKGVVYLGKDKQKMMMRANELHKFSDGTFNKVYKKLNVVLKDNVLGYGNEGLKDQEWTKKDKDMTKSMMIKIEKTLHGRRQMRRIERFVGGIRIKTDYRLLVRPE
nr:hypothetical protein [Tanacetum cinerariifolium]